VGAHKLRKVYIKIKNKAGMERGSFAPFPKIRKGVFFFFWGGERQAEPVVGFKKGTQRMARMTE